MPWSPQDAPRHTKKAATPKKQQQWRDVANSVLAKTGNEGRAVREANAVVKRKPARIESESHAYNWRSRENLRRKK